MQCMLVGSLPLEIESARLSCVDIHWVVSHMSLSCIRPTICHNIAFCWHPQECPAQIECMTPWLSEWMIMWSFRLPLAMMVRKASLTTTISAQPISRPSDLHSSRSSSFQANQWLLNNRQCPMLLMHQHRVCCHWAVVVVWLACQWSLNVVCISTI